MHLSDHNKIKLETNNRKNSEKSPNNTTLTMHGQRTNKKRHNVLELYEHEIWH